MFTSQELSILNISYFKQIMLASDVSELESQNGDHWLILKKQAPLPKRQRDKSKGLHYTYLIYHRHNDAEGFHFQSEMPDMLSVALELIQEDDYRLKRKGRTAFDEVLEEFS